MTDDDAVERVEAALERDRSFAGLEARAGAARALADMASVDATTLEAVGALLAAELDAPGAASERVTGLDALASDVQVACVDALTACPVDDPNAVAAALEPLARAAYSGRNAEIRTAAAEGCFDLMLEIETLPAAAVPVSELTTAFERGEPRVRKELTGASGGFIGRGGVFAAAARHAPERAPEVVTWLLRVDDFAYVDNRLSFERAVAASIPDREHEHADRVFDVVLEHLRDADPSHRRTATGALAKTPDAVPTERVEATVDALLERLDDDVVGVPRDATETVVALLVEAPRFADRVFTALRGSDAKSEHVLSRVHQLDDEIDPKVKQAAVGFFLGTCDGAATGRTAKWLGTYLSSGGQHRWVAVGTALVVGAAGDDEAASAAIATIARGVDPEDGDRVRALAVTADSQGLDPRSVFVALVPPPADVEGDTDRDRSLRILLTACVETTRASEPATRRRGRLAVDLLADVISESPADSINQDAEPTHEGVEAAVTDALDTVDTVGNATVESVAAQTRLAAAVPTSTTAADASTVTGLLTHEAAEIREHAVEYLAECGVRGRSTERAAVGATFVDRLVDDVDSVRRTAIEVVPEIVNFLPDKSRIELVDLLLERAASDQRHEQRRAFESLVEISESLHGERVTRVAAVALLGLGSERKGIRSVAADLLLAVAPRLDATRAPALVDGIVAATEMHADVVFDSLDVLWAVAATPGTGDAVARGFARLLSTSRTARDHLTDTSVGFEVDADAVRRLTDGLVDLIADEDAAASEALRAVDVVATTLPADRVDPVVEVLATAAESTNDAERVAAFDALDSVALTASSETPQATWAPLGRLLDHERTRVRHGAIATVGVILDAGGDPPAAANAADASHCSSTEDGSADASQDSQPLSRIVETRLADRSATVRVAATRVVPPLATTTGGSGLTWAVDRLLEQTTDDVPRVRRAAIESLQRIDDDAARAPARSRLVEIVADDPEAPVREAAVTALLEFGNDNPHAVLEGASPAFRDTDRDVRETAVVAVSAFVDRVDQCIDLRDRVLTKLGERIEADDCATVRREAAAAASSVVAAVGDVSDPDREGTSVDEEWPHTGWVREALSDDDPSVRGVAVDRILSFAPVTPPDRAAFVLRDLIATRRKHDEWPTEGDVATVTVLAEHLDHTELPPVAASLINQIPTAEGTTAHALVAALGEATRRKNAVANDVVETMLERIATAHQRTDPFGNTRPSPRATASHHVLVDLVETFPEMIGGHIDPKILPEYLEHERDIVRETAARVFAAIVEHGEDPEAAIRSREDIRACLAVDSLTEPTRLALLAVLADGRVLAHNPYADGDK